MVIHSFVPILYGGQIAANYRIKQRCMLFYTVIRFNNSLKILSEKLMVIGAPWAPQCKFTMQCLARSKLFANQRIRGGKCFNRCNEKWNRIRFPDQFQLKISNQSKVGKWVFSFQDMINNNINLAKFQPRRPDSTKASRVRATF